MTHPFKKQLFVGLGACSLCSLLAFQAGYRLAAKREASVDAEYVWEPRVAREPERELGVGADGSSTISQGRNVPPVRPVSLPAGDLVLSERSLLEAASRLRELAAVDPSLALSHAMKQSSVHLRQAFLSAALEGWSKSDPEGALDWAMGREDDSAPWVRVVLRASATSLAGSDRLFARVVETSSLERGERARLGFGVVEGLCRNGRFEDAMDFSGKWGGHSEPDWKNLAIAEWARYQPLAAVEYALRYGTPNLYGSAVAAWSQSDPGQLARFAMDLPVSDERTIALEQGVRVWVETDPGAASEWLAQQPLTPELDKGVLALATHPYLAERHPRTAITWAEGLQDPSLRGDTVALIIKQWAATDRKNALNYLRTCDGLNQTAREELLALFGGG